MALWTSGPLPPDRGGHRVYRNDGEWVFKEIQPLHANGGPDDE